MISAAVVCVISAQSTMNKKPVIPNYTEDSTEDEDPGFFFILWPTATGASSVHACVGLPSVANLRPPLQQGRSIASNNKFNGMFMLPGGTPEQSMNNLYLWLDNIMIGMGYASALAMASNGQRIPGVFHRMSKEDFFNFRGNLDTITRAWHIECLTNGLSAGYMLEVIGGTCGKGSLMASAITLGPFIPQ